MTINEESSASTNDLSTRIASTTQFAALPEAAAQLLILCQNPDVSADALVRVIELDPSLSARLLRVANSSYFGQSRRVNTLTRAAVLLGNEHLKAVALGFYLSRAWESSDSPGFDIKLFWRDSLTRACLARELARAARKSIREQAFLLGMIQDIGTLALVSYFGTDYVEWLQSPRQDPEERANSERSVFGTSHSDVLEAVVRQWQFPDTMCVALGRQCTRPPFCRTEDHAVVMWQLAYFCAAVPFSADYQTAKVHASLQHLALSAFDLAFESLSQVFSESVEQFNAIRTVFSDVLPPNCDITQMMEQAAHLLATLDPEATERVARL